MPCRGQLFFNTKISVCIWIIAKDKTGKKDNKRPRKGEVLFIDARNMGYMKNRTQKEFSEKDIEKVASTYHKWRNKDENYKDVVGFCKSATLDEIKSHDYILTPGRYVGMLEKVDDSVSFAKKMRELTVQLETQFTQSHKLEKEIKQNLESLGFGGKNE